MTLNPWRREGDSQDHTRTTRTEHDKTGEDVEREIPYLKGYTVFNVEQIDGMPDHYYAKAAPRLDPVTRIEQAENFFAASKAEIRYGGAAAADVNEEVEARAA